MSNILIKEEILRILQENVSRDGIDNLITMLKKTDFFTAPASTRFHGSYAGGLAEHSYQVYRNLLTEVENTYDINCVCPYTGETLALVGLCHDLCKINQYKVSTRNVKNEQTGQWEKVPYYAFNDDEEVPLPHSFKSEFVLSQHIWLTEEERFSIMAHMGGWDSAVRGGDQFVSKIYQKYPLALLLHVADLKATYIDKK